MKIDSKKKRMKEEEISMMERMKGRREGRRRNGSEWSGTLIRKKINKHESSV